VVYGLGTLRTLLRHRQSRTSGRLASGELVRDRLPHGARMVREDRFLARRIARSLAGQSSQAVNPEVAQERITWPNENR
jgi:hypothetical protein